MVLCGVVWWYCMVLLVRWCKRTWWCIVREIPATTQPSDMSTVEEDNYNHNHYCNHYLCHNHCHYRLSFPVPISHVTSLQGTTAVLPCDVASTSGWVGFALKMFLSFFLFFSFFLRAFCFLVLFILSLVFYLFFVFFCFLIFLPLILFLVLLLSVMFSTFSLAGRCFSHPMVQRQRHKANVQVRRVFCQPITTRRQLDMKKKSFVFMMYATSFAHSCSKFERHHHYRPPFCSVAGYHSFEVTWIIESHFISVERSREEKRRRKLWRFKKWQNFHTCTDLSPWDMTNPFPIYLNKTYLRHKHSKSHQFGQSLSWIQNPNTVQPSSSVNKKKFLFMPLSSLLYPIWKDRQVKMERHDNLVNWTIFIV